MATEIGLRTVGLVCDEQIEKTEDGIPVLGNSDQLEKIIVERGITQIIMLEFPLFTEINRHIISVCDQLLMLQYSIYSVISPEGCALILWKTAERAADAAEQLGITAHRLKALGLVDKIVNEPVGGAHRDAKQMAAFLKRALNDAFRQVSDLPVKELMQRRYDRLQSYGRFSDTTAR